MLLRAGLVPLPWFLVFATVAGFLQPGYSARAQHVSELTQVTGAPHALANVAGIGTGIGFILFAAGLWLVSNRRVAYGSLCWAVFGASMISNGIWPMGSPLHGLYGVGMLNLVAPALGLLELRGERDHPTAYAVTVFVSLAGIVYLWLNLTGNDPQGLRGLTQRVFSSINSLWPAVIAIGLVKQGERGMGNGER